MATDAVLPPALREDPALLGFLSRLASMPEIELEWIDLLSQLEYVGFRKIVKSVGFESVDLELLRHVSEEASHAYVLKSVVEEGGRTGRSWLKGRFSTIGWRYFQELDHRTSGLAAEAELRYPGVSWAIERRVLVVYPAYLRTTRHEGIQRALRRILAQEERHAERFGDFAFPEGYLARVAALEASLWPEFLDAAQALIPLSARD